MWAYHEAGHAVFGHYLGLRNGDVTIITTGPRNVLRVDDFTAAMWKLLRDNPSDALGRAWAENRVMVLFAGGLVEEKLGLRLEQSGIGWGGELLPDEFGDLSDMDKIIFLADRVCTSNDEAARFMSRMEDETVQLLPMLWPAIEELARALDRFITLSGEQVAEIVEAGWEE
jgi:hypothetical protein